MKILPINNTLNINNNYHFKPSFKGDFIAGDNEFGRSSYVDKTSFYKFSIQAR